MLAVRSAFTAAVVAAAVWALLAGYPLGAVFVVVAAIGLRRFAEAS